MSNFFIEIFVYSSGKNIGIREKEFSSRNSQAGKCSRKENKRISFLNEQGSASFDREVPWQRCPGRTKGDRLEKNGELKQLLNSHQLQRQYLEVSTLEYLEHISLGVENCRILDVEDSSFFTS